MTKAAKLRLPLALVVALVAVTAAACGQDPVGVDGPVPGREWTIETPQDQGMDPAPLELARAYAFAPQRNTQGVVVVHGGSIVAEWYAPGANAKSWAASWSVAKSFTGALIGIAIDEGKIESVDQSLADYFPEWKGTDKEAITIKDALQMSTGLAWTESPNSAANKSQFTEMMTGQPDQLKYAVSQALEAPPGENFNYSSVNSMLLSGVLEQATGMSASAYAAEKLFVPIGIEGAQWWQDAAGNSLTYCCIDATSRDFARFGLLYLRGGKWGEFNPIIDEDWIRSSLKKSSKTDAPYGYSWWLIESDALPGDVYSARGLDNQRIYVVPSMDLVVVRNGTYAKDPGPTVADPNLFDRYPSSGLVPGKGTIPPADWNDTIFLSAIIASVEGG